MHKLRIPSYRLHKPSGLAVVTINGKDRYLGKHGTKESRSAYDSLVGEWLAKGRESETIGGSVARLIDSYLKHARKYYVRKGETTSQFDSARRVCLQVRASHGTEQANSFGPRKLVAIRDGWIGQGLVRVTINGYVALLVEVFRWGAEQGIVEGNTWHSLQAVRALPVGRSGMRDNPPVGPVPIERIREVLANVSRRVGAMIRLQLLTGMRPGELVQMRQIDLDRSGATWVYKVPMPKSLHLGIDRFVAIPPRAVAVLEPFLKGDPNGMIFGRSMDGSKCRKITPSRIKSFVKSYRISIHTATLHAHPHPTIPSINAGHQTTENRRIVAEWLRPWAWHPHQLRHNAATLIRAATSLEDARLILGHSSTRMTERYAKVDWAGVLKVGSDALEKSDLF